MSRAATPTARTTRRLRLYRNYAKRVRRAVIALLGGECVMCHETDEDVLQVDHKEGAKEGYNERERSGHGLYLAIVKGRRSVEEFQLLCANCNARKRLTHGEIKGYKARKFGAA